MVVPFFAFLPLAGSTEGRPIASVTAQFGPMWNTSVFILVYMHYNMIAGG